jgi:hypothetical protein
MTEDSGKWISEDAVERCKPNIYIYIYNKAFSIDCVQSDKKESKLEKALQIIGHVVAESYANKPQSMGVDNL